jgi:hypothetical protein
MVPEFLQILFAQTLLSLRVHGAVRGSWHA